MNLCSAAAAQSEGCVLLEPAIQVCDLPDNIQLVSRRGNSAVWNGTDTRFMLSIIVNPDGFDQPFTQDSVTTFLAPSDDRSPNVTELMVDSRPAVLITQDWPNASGGTSQKTEAMIDFGASVSVVVSMATNADFSSAQSNFRMVLDAISLVDHS